MLLSTLSRFFNVAATFFFIFASNLSLVLFFLRAQLHKRKRAARPYTDARASRSPIKVSEEERLMEEMSEGCGFMQFFILLLLLLCSFPRRRSSSCYPFRYVSLSFNHP